jgi:hypothetical protein
MQLLRAEYSDVVRHGSLPGLRSCGRVHPSSSAIHGRGLFALDDLQPSEIVALYPVDGIWEDDHSGVVCASAEDVEHFGQQPPPMSYRAVVQPATGACVDANPNWPLVDGWLAHLVNDGASLKSFDSLDGAKGSGETDSQAVARYLHASLTAGNCVLMPFGRMPLLAAVTTTSICAGDELLTSYGVDYWTDEVDVEESDVAALVAAQLGQDQRDAVECAIEAQRSALLAAMTPENLDAASALGDGLDVARSRVRASMGVGSCA